MATSCSFLQLSLPKQSPNFTPLFPSRHLNLSIPSRRSSPSSLCFASSQLPYPISTNSDHKIKSSEKESVNSIESVNSVVNPSLHYANVMFFKTAYNVQIMVDEDENEEALLRRFRREVSKAGIIQECKRRKFFENKQEEKKRRVRDAAKRNRRRRYTPRPPITAAGDAANGPKKGADKDDDNWEMPAGGALPY